MNNTSTARTLNTIFLEEDEEDDVQAFSLPPQSRSQWNDLPPSSYDPRPVHIPILDDDDLELRLGPAENRPAASIPESSISLSLSNFSNPYYYTTIDLTCTDDNFDTNYRASRKRKRFLPPEPSREPKLICAICMDTMKEETSTICGHVFCHRCILEAMKVQKKCPTCRKRLLNSQIHRIYLP